MLRKRLKWSTNLRDTTDLKGFLFGIIGFMSQNTEGSVFSHYLIANKRKPLEKC